MAVVNSVYLLFLITLFVYAEYPDKSPNNYGPYNLKFIEYRECKGPKSKNATTISTAILDNGMGHINLTFLADTKFEEIRINVYNMADGKQNFLWHYKITNPCKHYIFYLIIKNFLDSENCIVKKGFYPCVVSYKDVTIALIGPTFFYGNYSFQAKVVSKTANIACLGTLMSVTKKTGSNV